MGDGALRLALRCLAWGALALGGFLGLRLLLPMIAPFLLAWALAALVEPGVRALGRRGLPRQLSSALLTLGLLGLIGWGLTSLILWAAGQAAELAGRAPELMTGLAARLEELRLLAQDLISQAPKETGEYISAALEALGQSLYSLPGLLSRQAMDLLASTAQLSPDILLFLVTAGIGAYLFSAGYPSVRAFAVRQLPQGMGQRLEELRGDLRTSFGGLLRSQLILMALSFIQLLVGFVIMRVEGALALAAVTAAIDALPVFGTGIVLLPWAAFCLLTGGSRRALGLILLWILVNLVRNCAQAKLLGDQIGLDPLASLAALYLGWQLWGVWGMLTFPILLVTLKQLNDRGAIRLWKS